MQPAFLTISLVRGVSHQEPICAPKYSSRTGKYVSPIEDTKGGIDPTKGQGTAHRVVICATGVQGEDAEEYTTPRPSWLSPFVALGVFDS